MSEANSWHPCACQRCTAELSLSCDPFPFSQPLALRESAVPMHFHTLYFSELKHISLLLLLTVTACASTARVLSSVGLLDWCLFGLLVLFFFLKASARKARVGLLQNSDWGAACSSCWLSWQLQFTQTLALPTDISCKWFWGRAPNCRCSRWCFHSVLDVIFTWT